MFLILYIRQDIVVQNYNTMSIMFSGSPVYTDLKKACTDCILHVLYYSAVLRFKCIS